jgi:hypothetical protein
MAANQVTVATPGPAGVPGLTYEGLWVVGSVYQVRDCVRYTDGNLYVVNVQHTAASGNNPIVNTTYWSLFINANDAFQWATLALIKSDQYVVLTIGLLPEAAVCCTLTT